MLALVWVLVSPWTQRDLATQGLFDLKAFIAFVYLLFLPSSSCWPRSASTISPRSAFAPETYPAAWASVWPLLAFVDGRGFLGTAEFFRPAAGFVPWLFLLAAMAAFSAQFFELGLRAD